MRKKINKDPFSNGSMYWTWIDRNCERCVKYVDGNHKYRCAIQRDIETRMISNEPIAQRVIDICHMDNCPYRQENYKQYKRKKAGIKAIGVLSLFE